MGEKMMEGNGTAFDRILGKELRDLIIDRKAVLLRQLENESSCVLLGKRANPKHRVLRDGNIVLEISRAVASKGDVIATTNS